MVYALNQISTDIRSKAMFFMSMADVQNCFLPNTCPLSLPHFIVLQPRVRPPRCDGILTAVFDSLHVQLKKKTGDPTFCSQIINFETG